MNREEPEESVLSATSISGHKRYILTKLTAPCLASNAGEDAHDSRNEAANFY